MGFLVSLIFTAAFAQADGVSTAPFKSSSILVAQAGYQMANARTQTSLATLGAGPCVVLALYDPVTKTSVLAHFDAMINAQSETDHLLSLFKDRHIPYSRLQASAAGGWKNNKPSEETSRGILKSLAAAGVDVVNKDLNVVDDPIKASTRKDGSFGTYALPSTPIFRSFQLDLATGAFTTFDRAEVHAATPPVAGGGAFLTRGEGSLDGVAQTLSSHPSATSPTDSVR